MGGSSGPRVRATTPHFPKNRNPGILRHMARVLLCDDDESFRLLARVHLESAGHEVVGENGDPDTCAAAIARSAPDVVVLDNFLPADVPLSSLRERAPHARFILCSGLPQEALDRRTTETGADAGLTKRDFTELPRAVDDVLA